MLRPEGFDFLGFTIRRMRKRGTSKHYVYTVPSKKAIQAVKDKVAAKTYRSTRNLDPEVLIQGINRTLAGWANYFRHAVSKAVFNAVDAHAWGRIMRWLRHKHQHGNSTIGMPELRRRFCAPGTWQFAVNGVRFTGASSVAVKARGAPGAVRAARRVRRAGRGNPPGAIPAGRPGPTQLTPTRRGLQMRWMRG